MKKDFISATPDAGGQGQSEVQVSAEVNPTFQSRETTANFNTNGQVLKSVKTVQNGIPFVTAIGLTCNTSVKSMIDITGFNRNVEGKTMYIGNVSMNANFNPTSFYWSILVGGLVSWYDEIQDDELIAKFSWYSSTGQLMSEGYTALVFDNEDGEDWKNYVINPSSSEMNAPANSQVATLIITLGKGRGDIGLYEGTEFMYYRLSLINQ